MLTVKNLTFWISLNKHLLTLHKEIMYYYLTVRYSIYVEHMSISMPVNLYIYPWYLILFIYIYISFYAFIYSFIHLFIYSFTSIYTFQHNCEMYVENMKLWRKSGVYFGFLHLLFWRINYLLLLECL
jgi:hypothetical protein